MLPYLLDLLLNAGKDAEIHVQRALSLLSVCMELLKYAGAERQGYRIIQKKGKVSINHHIVMILKQSVL